MAEQKFPERHRRALIEKHEHLSGCRAPRNMVKNRSHLIKRNSLKPFHEFLASTPGFQILKQGGNGHARPSEYPSAANALCIPFDRYTG